MKDGPPDPETWLRINDLFARALELNPADRTAFVRKECADSPAIGDEVLALLDADARADQFLAEPPPMPEPIVKMRRDPRHRLGQVVGQYRIDSILGEGGMGVVYQAADARMGRTVALKAIAPDVAKDPARRERLRREAHAAGSLKHAGIATVYALEEFGDDIFIAGEFVAGETLREEVARGPVEVACVLDTAIELAHALAAAHDRGVIHRDLKPENVMREATTGHVKILDFGLARIRDLSPDHPQLTIDGEVFGTPAYMSPEQIRRTPVDGRSDLFSLGIVLYELLTGTHPFPGPDAAATIVLILETDAPPFPGSGSGTGSSGNMRRGLEGIIRTLLRRAPDARFASAHQLAAALERVRAGDVSYSSDRIAFASHAIWWWKFHQAATSVFYALLIIPMWFARQALGPPWGRRLLLTAIVAVVAATTIRLHLWFAADSMPAEWNHQHSRNWKWLRAADLMVAVTLIVTGISVLEIPGAAPNGVLLVVAAVVALLSATIIEPATTRAAFGPQSRSGRAD